MTEKDEVAVTESGSDGKPGDSLAEELTPRQIVSELKVDH